MYYLLEEEKGKGDDAPVPWLIIYVLTTAMVRDEDAKHSGQGSGGTLGRGALAAVTKLQKTKEEGMEYAHTHEPNVSGRGRSTIISSVSRIVF